MAFDPEKAAIKFLRFFDMASLDKTALSQLAFWTKYLADTPVLAKIVYFSERILEDDDEPNDFNQPTF